MRVLFTGSSSFTGAWFVQRLVDQGHQVVATFQGDAESYQGVRAERRDLVLKAVAAEGGRAEFRCRFGDARFLEVAADGSYDVLCHHAADVTDYKNPDFDFARAVSNNTHRLREVFSILHHGGCSQVVATGSVFENDEGAGEKPLRAFSPYGLSKGLSWLALRHFALLQGMAVGKFVIPNPFGPYEEPRFTAYLMRSWAKGEEPQVGTPAYVRDNIHVDLLARAYARFVGNLPAAAGEVTHLGPCGYVETQGAFAQRFADAMRQRLGIPCALSLAHQTEFPEPRIRTNTDIVDAVEAEVLGFDEGKAWDAIADYYRTRIEGLS